MWQRTFSALFVATLSLSACVAQAPAPGGKKEPGRYQVAHAAVGGAAIVVCDTTDAQCWLSPDLGKAWFKFDRPPDAKPGVVGRYAVSVSAAGGLLVIICDTATGG